MPQIKAPQVRFKGFIEEWEEKKIGDVVDDLYNGQTPSRIVNNYWNGKINWLSRGELNRSIVTKTIEKISVSGQKSANLRLVPSGTFVIAITGLEATGTRGNCAILGIDTTLNQSCMAIYPNLNLLLTSFLFQWYRKNSEEYGIKFTQGTKQQSYNAAIIKKLDLVLPKVEEQVKIGDYFQRLDALIEQKEKKYQKLKQFKIAMLSQMFPKEGECTPKLRFKGFSGEWEENKLGEYAKFRRGSFPQPYGNKEWYDGEGSMPFVQVVDVTSNLALVKNTKQKISLIAQPKSVFVEQGSVVVTLQGSIGRVAILQYNAYLDRTLLIFEEFKNATNTYFWAYIIQELFEIEKKKAPGGTIKTITKDALSSFKIFIPNLIEQTKIGNYFQKLDTLIDLHQKELEKLKNMKKALLAKMFV